MFFVCVILWSIISLATSKSDKYDKIRGWLGILAFIGTVAITMIANIYNIK